MLFVVVCSVSGARERETHVYYTRTQKREKKRQRSVSHGAVVCMKAKKKVGNNRRKLKLTNKLTDRTLGSTGTLHWQLIVGLFLA